MTKPEPTLKDMMDSQPVTRHRFLATAGAGAALAAVPLDAAEAHMTSGLIDS